MNYWVVVGIGIAGIVGILAISLVVVIIDSVSNWLERTEYERDLSIEYLTRENENYNINNRFKIQSRQRSSPRGSDSNSYGVSTPQSDSYSRISNRDDSPES